MRRAPAPASGAGSRRWRSPSRGRLGFGPGTGWFARRRQLVRIAEVSGRRDLGAKALDAFGREPLLEESGGQRVRAPGTVGSPHEISRPSAYTQARVLPVLTFGLAAPAQKGCPLADQKAQYQISSFPLAGLLGVAPIGGRPMKPVRRTKSRTLPIAEPDTTATTSAVAATATSRRRRRWCAPERFRTSSQSAGPGAAGSRRSMLVRSRSVTFVPPPGECEAPRARH